MSHQTSSIKPRATKELTTARLEKINDFLSIYSSSDTNNYFSQTEWAEIKKNGITINQLHKIMCGPVRNPNDLGLLNEKLSLENFKGMLKKHGYTWTPYVTSVINEKELVLAQHIFYYFQQKDSVKVHLECIQNTITNHFDVPLNCSYKDEKFCISIYFKDSKYSLIIAEYLYDLFEDKILGITPGLGMMQIYVSHPTKAKNLQKHLITLLNNATWKGLSVN